MADILLILAPTPNPLSKELPKIAGVLPLGIAYIAASLAENAIPVEVLDLFNNPCSSGELRRVIREKMARIIGLSATTENYSNAIRIARLIKDVDPSTVVVLGGPHVTFTAEETLQETAVDVVVRQEGEFSMVELAQYYLRGRGSLERITGISFRDRAGAIIHNEPRPLIGNLDELPMPARHLFSDGRYATRYEPFITSRGCPYRCIFCSASAMSGGRYRMRSAPNVIDEIVFLANQGRKRINFSDDTMTASTRRLGAICDLLARLDLEIEWLCESRVDVLTLEILQRMRRLGCSIIQFGVESGSQQVLDQIQKGITTAQVEAAVRSAFQSGYDTIICSFMVGHPFDTEDTVQQSIDFATKLQSTYGVEVRFHVCTPYPGTHLILNKEELGVELVSRNYEDYNFFNPVMNLKHLTQSQVRNLYFSAARQVIDNLPEKLARGYSSMEQFGSTSHSAEK